MDTDPLLPMYVQPSLQRLIQRLRNYPKNKLIKKALQKREKKRGMQIVAGFPVLVPTSPKTIISLTSFQAN